MAGPRTKLTAVATTRHGTTERTYLTAHLAWYRPAMLILNVTAVLR